MNFGEFIKNFYREIVITFFVLLALSLLNWQGVFGFLSGFIHHAVILFLSLMMGGIAFLFRIRPEINSIKKQYYKTPETLRAPLSLFMQRKINDLSNFRQELMSRDGKVLNREELRDFVDDCFTANKKYPYVGTDSNVPSKFYAVYPFYLDKHIKDNPKPKLDSDVRILLTSEDELRADLKSSKKIFEKFYNEHNLKLVRLLQVEKNESGELAQMHGLPSTEIGVFGRGFVVFFIPPEDGGEDYRISIEPLDENNKRKIKAYLEFLNDNAKEIKLRNEKLTLHTRSDDDKSQDLVRLSNITRGGWIKQRFNS